MLGIFLIVLVITVLVIQIYVTLILQEEVDDLKKEVDSLQKEQWLNDYRLERNTRSIEGLAWDLYLVSEGEPLNTEEDD